MRTPKYVVVEHVVSYAADVADPVEERTVIRTVPARVGLVGNPSDGFGGAVFATVIPSLTASLTARASTGVSLIGPACARHHPSAPEWIEDIRTSGHVGEQRVVSAALWTLVEHLEHVGDHSTGLGVHLTWTTSIPRSVGLAGSSALAVGAIEATAGLWGVQLDRRVTAALALSAERDVLGIASGWQDRIVQSFRTAVLVDASMMDVVDGVGVPRVRSLADSAERDLAHLPLVVGWCEADGSSSEDYHGPLRTAGESLEGPMSELARLARSAFVAASVGDIVALAAAVDAGWQIRQEHAPLRPDHAALVERMRTEGFSATTPGSGGAVVAVCVDETEATRAVGVLEAAGCTARRFDLSNSSRV